MLVAAVKKGDFIELDYTGRLADEDIVFDTTREETAKESDLNKEAKYEPIVICIGQEHVIKGLDKNLEGREIGKSYTFTVAPVDAFGSRNPKLIKLIAASKFRQQGLNPVPGMHVNIDNLVGTVLRTGSGRTVVDFNHPLAGKELKYDVVIKRVVTEVNEKVEAVVKILGIKVETKLEADTLVLTAPADASKQMKDTATKAITGSIPEIRKVSFVKGTTDGASSEKVNNKI